MRETTRLTAGADLTAPGGGRIQLRPIIESDMPLLNRVYASTREQELRPVPWSDEQKREFLGQQFRAQHIFYQQQFPEADFLVIEYGEDPAGRIYIDRRTDEIRLVDIALLPQWRGSGIGSLLLRELMSEAADRSVPLRIHVEKNNPAMSLYRRLGFQAIEDQGVYDLMEWRDEGNAD